MQQGVDLDFPGPTSTRLNQSKTCNPSHQTRLSASTRPLTAKPAQPITSCLSELSQPTAPDMKFIVTDALNPFVFLQRYRVAVCKECGWAVVAEEILTHLQKRHRAIPVKQRRQLAVAIASHHGIIRNQKDLAEFQYPPPTINYIPQLAPP